MRTTADLPRPHIVTALFNVFCVNIVSASAAAESAGTWQLRLQLLEDHLKRNYIENGRCPCSHMLVYSRGKVVQSALQTRVQSINFFAAWAT